MKIALAALTLATLLIPAVSFAHDFDRWGPRQSRVEENFERDHPRRPRAYCHTHRYPLNRDDTRRHCHNWNRQSWASAHSEWRSTNGGWDRYDRRADRWGRERDVYDRYDRDPYDSVRGWWNHFFQ